MLFAMNSCRPIAPGRSGGKSIGWACIALWSGALVLWALLSAARPLESGPAGRLQHIMASVADIVRAEPPGQGRQGREMFVRARDEVAANLAIEAAAGHILGRKIWQGLTGGERQEFMMLLGALLQPAIAGKLAAYGDGEMVVVDEEISGDMALVKTRITASGRVSSIVFTMLSRSERWLIFDINVDGASLLRNLMAQIRPIAGRSGIRGVMVELQRLAAENQAKAAAGEGNGLLDR